jgi:hypothetical protein
MGWLSEDDTERGGWGPFSLPADHPFWPAFAVHDRIFASKAAGFPTMGRRNADRALLRSMLTIAAEKQSASLRAQAFLYYGVARAFGKLFW